MAKWDIPVRLLFPFVGLAKWSVVNVGVDDRCSLGDRCDAKSRCEVCLLRGVVRSVSSLCVLQGVVASMECSQQGMSSWDESLSGSGSVPVKAVSPVVPVD